MNFQDNNKDKNIINEGKSPNLQSFISWYSWGNEAFEKAKAEDKPILLSIFGNWCHWCHVMDETTYNDEEVAEIISENYIPIRVDTDRRPDINARYNLGGWPTTAFLTPEGDIITGGTYIPPDKMLEVLESVYHFYRKDPEGIKKEARERIKAEELRSGRPPRMETEVRAEGRETETFADLIGFAASQVKKSYDSQYGGFGNFPKFPMVDALELAQLAYLYQGGREWENIFTHTLRSMFEGGIYDRVEGGFFRYSTTRDWSVPHYEKMLEDNAQLLYILLLAYRLTSDELFARVSRDMLRYLESNLYMPEAGGWAGSQDADEKYYSLPLDDRQQRAKPRIDSTIYVNWNALLVRSLFLAAVILAESRWHDLALETLKMLKKRCYLKGKGMAHYLDVEENKAKIWGLLDDQSSMGLALTAAYQHTGDPGWLELSRELADYCLEYLSSNGGALSDRPFIEQGEGKLALPLFDPRSNSLCARWFVELASLTGEEAFLEKAADIVHAFMDEYREHGLFSTSLALAAFGARERGAVIDVVGNDGDPGLLPLHSAAIAAVVPPKVVRLLKPEAAKEMGLDQYAGVQEARAFACLGRHCFEPAATPEQLQQTVDKMIEERRAHVLFTVKESARV
ncbi:MAG TPA: hypothetical protein DCD97_00150 [Firmicutes bacterium]|jgi:uncharacterized protein YyaL (SSP411 family)|nr:hypothetical protein [Bacillota bacterium]